MSKDDAPPPAGAGGPGAADGSKRSAGNPAHLARPDHVEAESKPRGTVFSCDLCGNPMLDLHCKLICERCGYKRDCSDP